jgi:heptosyltransferase-2/heptosyltransferase-3
VVRFGAMGDMVLVLPLIQMIAAHAGRPVSLVTSGGWSRPLLAGQQGVGEIRVLSSRKAPYWFNASQRDFVRWLAAQRGARVHLCETDRKSLWLVRRAGIPEADICWSGSDPVRPGEHWIERWLRLGARWCGRPEFTAAERQAMLSQRWLDVADALRTDAAAWLGGRGWSGQPFVLLQPGNKRTMRRGPIDRRSNLKFWPNAHWIALCRQLRAERPDTHVFLCGSPEEAGYLATIAEGVGDPAVASLADDLPIPRLLALQTLAQGMISVDTGPAHAAAAVGCPLVVLFGPHDPALWRPYAVRAPVEVLQRNGPDGVAAIAAIDVADVLSAWRRVATHRCG